MPYAYTGLDSPRNATIVDVTEDNLLPLLVVWLFFTTNPNFLSRPTPEGYTGFDFQNFADGLGLSVTCVQNLFNFAQRSTNLVALQTVAKLFQTIAGPGGSGGYEGPTSCGAFTTIAELSPVAKTVWEDD
jgi:hypothetical protein